MALALLCSVFVSFTPNQVSWCQIVHLSALKLISFADILLDDILKTYWSSQVCVCFHSWLSGLLAPFWGAVEYGSLIPPGLLSAMTP